MTLRSIKSVIHKVNLLKEKEGTIIQKEALKVKVEKSAKKKIINIMIKTK